jgi:hypothetical protein
MTLITQANLDAQQKAVRRARRLLDEAADMATKAADELCAPEQCEASSQVGLIGAELRKAAAHAEAAHRMARTLQIPVNGGIIAPAFGGDK